MVGVPETMGNGNPTKAKVFVRFRRMNKLEASKRSKDCVELHDDPTKVTVDSPLQGIFDFTFDSVFDEYATQREVYKESGLNLIPERLLREGIDCTVLAWGQTATGKSHLIFGPSATSDLLELKKTSERRRRPQTELEDTTDVGGGENSGLTESQGMMARVVVDLFDFIETQLPASTECIIKFSMVELYLERWTDLLGAAGVTGESAGAIWVDQQSQMHGACELCCLHPQDVIRAMIRGTLRRMKSATEQNMDATRSHVILQLRVEQIDRHTNTAGSATLRMVDLAGSELGKTRSSRQINSPLALEGRMVSASLQSLFNYVRAKVAAQTGENSKGRGGRMHPSQAYANVSKLTRLLQGSMDGPCYTTAFLTASPSSYNIDETLNTLKFGTKVQKLSLAPPRSVDAKIWTKLPFQDYPAHLQHAERRVENLTNFVKLLAVECRIVRKTGKIKQSHAVWDVISRIAKSAGEADDDASDLIISVTRKGDKDEEVETTDSTVHKKLQEAQAGKEKAESSMRDYQSEVTTLKAEAEVLKNEKEKLERELRESKEELQQLNEDKMEADRHFRTSRFRENEAVVFLRQFRSFYFRLLKSKASQGNGEINLIVNDVIQQVAGAADLKDLLDVDRLMIESGLMEDTEASEDTNDPSYSPSPEAAQKSEAEAQKAANREMEALEALKGGPIEPGEVTVYRQKLVESPAGRLAMKKQKELDENIIELTSKCAGLQNSINAEKAMVEALSARQGALGKMKAAQEMNTIKSELERRSNDLQAIVWKMNELHLVIKTVNEKVENRETHVAYLQETLSNLQSKNRQLLLKKQEDEKKLREEKEALQIQLECAAVKLWQLGEESAELASRWKVIASASGEPIDLESNKTERRISLGDIADEGIELLEPPGESKIDVSVSTQTDAAPESDSVEAAEAATQTDEIVLDIDDAGVQTDPVQVLEIGEAKPTEKTASQESSVASTQTEMTGSETVETSVQTEGKLRVEVDCLDMGIQTISELHYDVGVQTEESEPVEAPIKVEIRDSAMQTESYAGDDSIAVNPSIEMVEIGMQTERERTKICFEVSTQTDDLPEEIALPMTRGHDSAGSMENEDADDITQTSSRAKRPPKPKPTEPAQSKFGVNDGINLQNSIGSLGSVGSLPRDQSSPKPVETLGGSMNWTGNVPNLPNVPIDDRLGVSMSALQGPVQKTTDWKSKLRQKGEETPITPNSSQKSKLKWTAGPSKMNAPTVAPSTNRNASKKSSIACSSSDTHLPEWMSKFREIGLKAGKDEDGGEKVTPGGKSQNKVASSGASPLPTFGGVPSVPAYPPTEKPDWMQKLKSSKSPKPTSSKYAISGNSMNVSLPVPVSPQPEKGSLPVAPWAKHMRRSSISGPASSAEPVAAMISKEPEWAQARRASMATKEMPPPPPEPSSPGNTISDASNKEQPEWVKRFKEIGMKGEEEVIESSRDKGAKSDDFPKDEGQEPKPEWMLKFQEITGSTNATGST